MALTVLKTRCATQVEDPNIIYRVEASGHALTAPTEGGSSTWYRTFKEGPVICSGLDQGMNNAGHFGGNRDRRLAPQIFILPVLSDVPAEAIALTDGDLGSQPEGTA